MFVLKNRILIIYSRFKRPNKAEYAPVLCIHWIFNNKINADESSLWSRPCIHIKQREKLLCAMTIGAHQLCQGREDWRKVPIRHEKLFLSSFIVYITCDVHFPVLLHFSILKSYQKRFDASTPLAHWISKYTWIVQSQAIFHKTTFASLETHL